MKHIALSTLILLGAPIAAMAGGPAVPTIEPQVTMPAPVVMAPQPVNWGGLYTGVSLGFGNSYTNNPGQGNRLGVAGVNLGYRYDLGSLIVGGELSYDKDNVNVDTSSSGNGIENTTALKLIVGKSLGRTLVYGTVGVANANANVAGVSGSDTGYTVGIGADYALNQQWTIGGELSNSRFNDFNSSGVDLQDTTMKVKVGFKF
ncbi:MAG: outer membrane protein [Cypionkella sp.]